MALSMQKASNIMQCQKCGSETMMPFRCPFCGGQFCSQHRLPENHNCIGISNARAQTQQRVITQQSDGSYNYSYVYSQNLYKRQQRIRWSKKEAKHLGIAIALVIGIGLSMGIYNFAPWTLRGWTWEAIGAFAVVMTVSFLVHEIAHKVMAQKSGMWAEFRLITWSAVLTLVSVFLPFKMIAPGAMMIGGSPPSAKNMIKIAIAGVITNMIFAVTFLGLAFGLPSNAYTGMLFFSAYINSFMAVFNLVPFGVLDGYKIYMLNKKVWVLAFTPAVSLIVVSGLSFFVYL
jgi:Zn-dependent protease